MCGQKHNTPKYVNGKPKLDKRGRPILIKLHAAHLLPKEFYPQYKFDPMNGLATCPLHHRYGKYSCHRNQLWWTEWLRLNYPIRFKWAVERLGNWDERKT